MNSHPQGQPRNRLSFFYADRQKGATTHDKAKRETREELTAEIEDGKKKIRQFENREKDAASKLSKRNAEHAATALLSGARSLKKH